MAYEGTKLADFAPIGQVSELQIIDIDEGTGAVVQPSPHTTRAPYVKTVSFSRAATTSVSQFHSDSIK